MKKNRFVAILLASSISTPLLFSADALEKFRQGVDKFKGGDYAASQKELSEFIKEHPYEVEVKKSWYYLARIAAAQKKYKDAIERINITLSRYPRHEDRVELNVLLGECLYEVNAHAHAEKVLQSVRTSAKDEALLYRLEKKLGFIAYAARRDAKTVEHLKAALRLAEKNAPHDSELFNVYATLGKVTAK
ncbi:MAG TPA: tetratricopeptide repeat protein, partial [Turneriella sp.]|nr:tetratricopeptide repeat protein [Turneriella sp.]